ncbi:MAG: GNAT family N-acetyltransferase [Ruminococcus sp.]|nr:GNAT family N-acetyltransferase [Ruminococcus sp.]MCM1291943.1 GNAT family N-acetyltransferase [Bacteroides sp.]
MNRKEEMMRLWKDTFHDSDKYINLVFDNYYHEDKCFVSEMNDKIVSGMLCVPYKLGLSINKNNQLDDRKNLKSINVDNNKDILFLRSIYQCGLATVPYLRHRGLMSKLINSANCNLHENNFAISFLIPSDGEKRLFYHKFGYRNISYLNIERYTSLHTFKNGIYIIDNTISNQLKIKLNKGKKYNIYIVADCKKEYFEWYKILSNNMSGCRVLHTFEDFRILIEENIISGGKILFLTANDNKPLAMLFCSNIEEDETTVQLLVSESEESELILLQTLKSLVPECASLIVRKYCLSSHSENTHQIYQPFGVVPSMVGESSAVEPFTSVVESEELRKPYAMAKILNVGEVLRFVAKMYPNSEFTILIRHDEFAENEGLYMVTGGRMEFTSLKDLSPNCYKAVIEKTISKVEWYDTSVPELAAILFRNAPEQTVAEQVITIPRLPVNIALMLD